VGGNLASALPLSSASFKSYMGPPIQNSIFVSSISIEEVYNLINSMSGGTAAGDDGFSLDLIKNNVDSLAHPLTHIFNLSLYSGTVPHAFKLAKVIPLFKKGDEKLPSNYRPISLLSIFNKVLEKLISKRLYNFFEHENINFL